MGSVYPERALFTASTLGQPFLQDGREKLEIDLCLVETESISCRNRLLVTMTEYCASYGATPYTNHIFWCVSNESFAFILGH